MSAFPHGVGSDHGPVKYQIHERPTLELAVVTDASDRGSAIKRAVVAIGCLCPFPRRYSTAEKPRSGPRAGGVEAALEWVAKTLADDAELIDITKAARTISAIC